MDVQPGAIPEPRGDAPATADAPRPARQRWRLVLARAADAPDLSGRDLTDAWESVLESSGLPAFIPAGRARARVAFGAPLSSGIAAENELADIVLTEFEPAWRVREALEVRLPAGWRLVDLYDVWLGEAALAGQVVAADYRIELDKGADAEAIASAAGDLLAADRLPRERQKGSATVAYDLRPLLVDVTVADPGPPTVVRARTRIHPELGVGRPAEVVAALGSVLGVEFVVGSVVRERLILANGADGDR